MADEFGNLIGDNIRTSEDMGAIRKDSLTNRAGVRYRDFRATLTPKYYLVWTHLLAGHLTLGMIAAIVVVLSHWFPQLLPVTVLVASICFGYTHAYINLFTHEAAHYNLARNRRLNDILGNIFVGSLVGLDIKAYREIHFDHHRYLGMPQDTEHTYFDPLNLRFVVDCMTGTKPLKAMTERKKAMAAKQSKDGNIFQLLFGVLLNLLVIGGAAWLGYWQLVASWIIGLVVFYPFFHAVRQLLEHRDERAERAIDYRITPHGVTNKMFGDGPLAHTFGGAGFNRHLLHHWEPQLSYTRLKELEDYLMETDVAEVLKSHQTSYLKTFVRLFNR